MAKGMPERRSIYKETREKYIGQGFERDGVVSGERRSFFASPTGMKIIFKRVGWERGVLVV
jgi:hypothetical protein